MLSSTKKVYLIHGWAANRHVFDDLIPRLPADWQCYALNLAGHGDAAFDLNGYSIFLKLPGIKKLILGNHDLGNIPVGIFDRIYGCVKYHDSWLTHIPVHPFEFKARKINFNIHAHTHMENIVDFEKRYINVSCDYLYSLIGHFMIKHEIILSMLSDLNRVTYV